MDKKITINISLELSLKGEQFTQFNNIEDYNHLKSLLGLLDSTNTQLVRAKTSLIEDDFNTLNVVDVNI